MPRAVVAVAESLLAVQDAHVTRADVLAVLQHEAPARVASAQVVVVGATYRKDGVAVVSARDLTEGLRAVDALPDPIRVLAVPRSAWRKRPVTEAEAVASKAGRVLLVVPVEPGGSGLVEAVNEWGVAPTARILAHPGLPVDEDPVAAPTSGEPVPDAPKAP